MAFKARSGTACEIARVDKDRFNEAVHAGHYPCAPATRPGASRVFELNDLVVLYIYGRLLDEGVSTIAAGGTACRIREAIEDHPSADSFAIAIAANGRKFCLPAKDVKFSSSNFSGAGPLVITSYYNVENLRMIISQAIEGEIPIVGLD